MSEYIKIGDKQLLVGLNWNDKEGKSKRVIVSEIKKEAKENGTRFGYISEFKKNDNKDKIGTCQYLLFPNGDPDTILGSAIISSVFKDSIFIKKIETDNIEDNKYWVCAVDNEGLVYEDGDKIITDDDELELFVDEMTALYEMKVVSYVDDFSFLDIELDVELEDEFLDSYITSSEFSIKEIIKESKVNKKYIAGLLGVTGVIAGGFFLFYEDPYYDYFENGVFNQELSPLSKELKKYKKENKKKGKKDSYTQEQYSEIGKKHFRDYYDSNFYSNKEIVGNVLYLDKILQSYAIEWELSKMSYSKNEFLIMYDRVPMSIGVFKDLDEYINKISKSNNIIDISPVALVNNGTRRVYKVVFEKENINEKFYIARKLKEDSKVSKEDILNKLEKDVKSIENEIGNISYSIKQLNIFQRLFSNDVLIAHDEVNQKINKLKKLYKVIDEEIYKEEENVVVESNRLNGSDLKYIELSQRDNLFNWSYPAKGNIFPNIKVNKADLVKLKGYAKSYKVEMSSIEEVSTGVFYMEEALNLIDQNYLQIKAVEVVKLDATWSITSEVFEGIYDYELDETKNKELESKSKNKKK